MTLSARLPLVLGAALAATLAAAGAFFLLAQGGSSAEQATDQAAQTGRPALPPEAKQERVPQALTSALDGHEVVVVVAWFAPVDAAAMAEAREGARAAGAGFVRVNVMKEPSALAFADDHGGLESPAVFVFTRGRNGPELRTRLPGTPDRDVVAQAASNAS